MPANLWMFLAIVACAGAYFFARNLRRGLKARGPRKRIAGVPLTCIADISEGQEVKVRGRVSLASEPLTAPYSGKPCVAYDLRIEHRRAHVSGSKGNAYETWHEADEERGAVRFAVDDGTGSVIVEATSGAVTFVMADSGYLTVGDNRQHVLELLSRKVDTRLVRGDDFRYDEWRLEEGDEVAVVGCVVGRAPASADAANYRDTAERWLISGTSDDPIYVTDREELVGRPPHAPVR